MILVAVTWGRVARRPFASNQNRPETFRPGLVLGPSQLADVLLVLLSQVAVEKLVAPLAWWVWLSFVNLRSAVWRVFQAVWRVFQAAGGPSPLPVMDLGLRHLRLIDVGLWPSPVGILALVVPEVWDPNVPVLAS